ncbi:MULTISPECIES: hypothetical protein [Alistipes]|uniref:hypothetical protein n=2 Tax=Rikenellaceae TaxID=171550 RepID=UPI00101FE52F|nr:hypothetical protein [Alistipes onderdonkii]
MAALIYRLPPRFTCLPLPPPLFTFDVSVLPFVALVISLPPLPGSGKTEHRFCAFLPPSRRPFLDPVRRACHLAAAASRFRQDRTSFLSLPAAIAQAVS